MEKRNIIFTVISVLIILSIITLTSCSKKKPVAMSASDSGLLSYASKDSQIVLRAKNLNKTYSELVDSHFYKQLMSYDFVKSTIQEINNADFSKAKDLLGFEPNLSMLTNFFASDILFTFSFRNTDMVFHFSARYDAGGDSILKSIDSVLPEIFKEEKDVKFSSENFKDVKITTVDYFVNESLFMQNSRDVREQQKISYFFFNGIMSVSNNSEQLKTMITAIKEGPKDTIISDPTFLQTFEKLDANKQIIAYCKMKELAQKVLEHPVIKQMAKRDEIERYLMTWDIINSIGGAVELGQNTVIKTYSFFNNETKHKDLLELYKKKPEKLKTAFFAPAEANVFLAWGFADALKYYDVLTSSYMDEKVKKDFNNAVAQLKKEPINIDLRNDIIKSIGNEMAFCLFDLKYSIMPDDHLNAFLLALHLKDQKKIAGIISNLIKSNPSNKIKMENSKYNGPLLLTSFMRSKMILC